MSDRNVNPKVTQINYIYFLIQFLLLIIIYILFKLQMPDKKNLQSGFCLFLQILKCNPCLRNIIYYSVIPYCVSQQRIKTAFKAFNKI